MNKEQWDQYKLRQRVQKRKEQKFKGQVWYRAGMSSKGFIVDGKYKIGENDELIKLTASDIEAAKQLTRR
jgi:ribosomal protein L16/L10AE